MLLLCVAKSWCHCSIVLLCHLVILSLYHCVILPSPGPRWPSTARWPGKRHRFTSEDASFCAGLFHRQSLGRGLETGESFIGTFRNVFNVVKIFNNLSIYGYLSIDLYLSICLYLSINRSIYLFHRYLRLEWTKKVTIIYWQRWWVSLNQIIG